MKWRLRKSFSLLQHSSKEHCSPLLGKWSVQSQEEQLLREHFVSTPAAFVGCPNPACVQIPSAFANAEVGTTSSLFFPSILSFQQDNKEDKRRSSSVLRAEEYLREGDLGYWKGLMKQPESSRAMFESFCSKVYCKHGHFAWRQWV